MHKTLDSAQFRKVMARFVTGVTIVTSRAGEEVHGMTCNAFCSISIAPLTVMVCLTRNSRTERLIGKGRVFAVNVLSESQTDLSDRFAGRHKERDENRFDGFPWTTAVTGAPIFKGSQAYVDCKLMKTFDGGSHIIHLGEVVAAHTDNLKRPLIFYQSRYMGLASLKPLE
ncbi:MAG: flavin reductase [Acidobacteria bacterium]|nr:MAG: flavin reductase [Acidobacteriota bacterium]